MTLLIAIISHAIDQRAHRRAARLGQSWGW